MKNKKNTIILKKCAAALLAAVCLIMLFGCGPGPAAGTSNPSPSQGVHAAATLTEGPAGSPTLSASPSPGVSSPASASPSSKPSTQPTVKPSAAPSTASSDKPLKGVVIGLDPGHQLHQDSGLEPVAPGSSDMKMKVSSGTQGVKSRVEEQAVNLNVSLKLRDMLQAAGATVVMTRTTADVDITNIERAQIFNDKKVDLGIRIHCNGVDDESVHGAFMLIPQSNPFEADCKLAANLIINNYVEATGLKKLGTEVRSDQTGFNWCERPIVNIEMGHMSNPEEDTKITGKDFQTTMAKGIYNGILEYFKEK